MTAGYIITGTDTNVGKTVFAAALTRALGAAYWKPIQSGLDGITDSVSVSALAELPAERLIPEAYRLPMPASPHIAARHAGIEIDIARLTRLPAASPLVVEGAGGVLVPITDDYLMADLFAAWGLPAIVCARTTLGTINHTLLTVEALVRRQVPVCGIAFIGDENSDVEATIVRLADVPRLGRLPLLSPLTPATLAAAFRAGFGALSGEPS
ncbi:MAG: ATP-dependent dethiobiotin synthetase BioD [Pseudomonadota bacterium]